MAARNMALLYDGHDYYKKMLELREKLRKSEEERIRLEERFNVLVRESSNRHDACLNRLRMRYIHYLEEQRTRDERNHKLLAALDKVMSKLALISAKKERLNVLRKQYEAYLLRVYANRQPPSSVTGDSGIASQHDDKYPGKTVVETRNVPSPPTHRTPSHSSQPKSTFVTKFHHQVPINDASPINRPILSTASSGAAHGIDYRRVNVSHPPQVHVSSIDQSGDQFVHQTPSMNAPLDTRQYREMTFGFEGDAPPSDLRNREIGILPAVAGQPDIVNPVNQFFLEPMESMQVAASGLSATMQLPTNDATRRRVESESVSRQFHLPASLRYHNANNALLSDPQSRTKRYDTLDAAASIRPNSVITKSNTYRLSPDANRESDQFAGSLAGYMDYTLTNPHKSDDESSVRSLTSDDMNDLIRRNELLWKNADAASKTHPSSIALGAVNDDLDENGRTTAILENELDRYISNIRKLHQEHGMQSLDELDHEQNTSGDLLNVTLSEDALELPAEDRKNKKERIPEEMGKVLALANDLVSKTAASSRKVARPIKRIDDNVSSAEVHDGIGQHHHREEMAKNKIKGNNVAMMMESEQSRADAEIAEEKSDEKGSPTEPVIQESDDEVKDAKKEMIASLRNDKSRIDNNQGNAPQEKQLHLVTGQQSDIENLFDVAEQLAPWDLASVQKQVLELHLDNSEGEEGRSIMETADQNFIGQSDMGKLEEPVRMLPRDAEFVHAEAETSESREKDETRARVEEARGVSSEISSHRVTDEPIKTDEAIAAPRIKEDKFSEPDENDETGRKQEETSDETAERVVQRNDHYSTGEYQEEDQAQRYAQQDPNYEHHVTYEGGTGNEDGYETYVDQGYAQEGQEYVEYVDGQYEQYPEDPNSRQYQLDPNAQYEQDPNQAYAYNYDPNGGYADPNDPNQQYDPNQGYGDDPNQAYGYAEQAYDPNQLYDNGAYEQGYPEEDVVNVEKSEPRETPQSLQADSQSERKSDEDGDKRQETENGEANGTNRSKKKRDVIKSLLDSDTDTTIERNVSNTESDFDFN